MAFAGLVSVETGMLAAQVLGRWFCLTPLDADSLMLSVFNVSLDVGI